MKRKPIYMFYPFMPETVIEKVAETLKSRWVGQGPKVDEFEKQFAKKLGLQYVIFVNTGTSALRLALATAGVGPGDEVISPALTCTATNTPILEQFAIPAFADIEYETININPNDIEHRITDKTKAIMCVHWAGYPCDMDEICRIAKNHNLVVIEDAAHAIRASYKGKPVGSISDFTTFSLQAIKQITTGDGGVLSLKDKKNYESAMRRRWYGIDRAHRKPSVLGHDPAYDVWEFGYKYNPNDIAATIGLEQLKYLDSVIKRRGEIAKRYREELEKVPGITLLENKNDRKSANWLFTIHVNRRLKFAEMMQSKGVEVSVVHWRNDKYTIFGPLRKDLPNTDKAHETMISIPLNMTLIDDDVDYIIKSIKAGW
jgi:perosamine synthetase